MSDLKSVLRARFGYRCGYCGVTEIDSGNELEIDHFQPRTQGGSDQLENLIYACPACNRNKSDYWPAPQTPSHRHLLHPLEDDFSSHIRALENGELAGITPRGQFHIEWLHLNRPQLNLAPSTKVVANSTTDRGQPVTDLESTIAKRNFAAARRTN